MSVCFSFAPVVDARTQVLILGSMPGRRSLQQNQYYAHPRNLFWHFMFALYEVDYSTAYAARLALLAQHQIGLWDVYSHCERAGSLDQHINRKRSDFNDFVTLFNHYPSINRVAFNGAEASRAFKRYVKLNPEIKKFLVSKTLLDLPSTSPANAGQSKSFKYEQWQATKVLG